MRDETSRCGRLVNYGSWVPSGFSRCLILGSALKDANNSQSTPALKHKAKPPKPSLVVQGFDRVQHGSSVLWGGSGKRAPGTRKRIQLLLRPGFCLLDRLWSSVAEKRDMERTPSRRPSRAELLDHLPASIMSRFEERRLEEQGMSVRKKLTSGPTVLRQNRLESEPSFRTTLYQRIKTILL